MCWWQDRPEILAGRDLEARGTWMGVSRSGRFAAVTNYRGAREPRARESRGALVTAALLAPSSAHIVAELESRKEHYSGFNLLVVDDEELWSLSNRDGARRRLEPGIYALGNTALDAPEVQAPKAAFAAQIAAAASVESLMELMGRWRIRNDAYGTRCTSVLRRDEGKVRYAERPFAPDGAALETAHFVF